MHAAPRKAVAFVLLHCTPALMLSQLLGTFQDMSTLPNPHFMVQGFIRKVFGLLAVQLAITVAVTAAFLFR